MKALGVTLQPKLFELDRTLITRRIGNVCKEGKLDESSNGQNLHIVGSEKPVCSYNHGIIISVV